MIVPYSHILVFSAILFVMGISCLLARRNLIMMVLGLEIMLNAASIAFVGASLRWLHLDGQAMAIFIMAVAAAEVSIGLALIDSKFGKDDDVEIDVRGRRIRARIVSGHLMSNTPPYARAVVYA